MPQLKTVSLIIPAYNEELYIKHCLDSFIQGLGTKFLEIIVVDNNSTDKTSEVARSYPGVQVFVEKEKGVTRARAYGARQAKGDLLIFMDSDNIMPPHWYDQMIYEFTENDSLVCLSGPIFFKDIPTWKQFLVNVYWYVLAVPVKLFIGYMAIAGNLVIRKDVLEKMGGIDTSIEFYGDDTNTVRRASKFGKVKFLPSFYMYSSGRRLQNQGIFSTSLTYALNFFSEVIFKKPATKNYKDFR